jgi:peptide/nickel transport system substrate-binding protein
MIRRRALVTGGLASLALTAGRNALALGRIPASGRLRFALPWPLERLDPHDLFDPVAALFAHAICDTVFALDAAGEPYPTLAAEPPSADGGKTTVRLRPGIVSARGRPVAARDLIFSLDRARRAGGRAVWADLPAPVPSAKDPLLVVVPSSDAPRIARALASPLLSLLPRTFTPERPDGTGAFKADFAPGRLTLARNPRAARGASFLDEILVEQAADLSGSLRALEGDAADLGWLGASLHTRRADVVSFDAGAMGFIVLVGGSEAGAWGAPGAIQRLIEDLPSERFQHLGLGPLGPPRAGGGQPQWGGNPCDLYFEQGAAQLEELARVLTSLISRPGHEVTPRPLPASELARRRASRAFSLLMGIVRPVGPPGPATLVALTGAVDDTAAIDVMKAPPKLTSFAPNLLARTLRLGLLGELRVTGAHRPDVHVAKNSDGWDLASSYRASLDRS